MNNITNKPVVYRQKKYSLTNRQENPSKKEISFKGGLKVLGKDCFEIAGSQTKAKIFAKEISDEAVSEIEELCSYPIFYNAPIRIMPDVSACRKCVVGFTAKIDPEKVNELSPDIIGTDIGCGVLLVKTDTKAGDVDLENLDRFIKTELFTNKKLRPEIPANLKQDIKESCQQYKRDDEIVFDQMGTLGNGNHFIELDKDADDNIYLAIHTGSRQYGDFVKSYYLANRQPQNELFYSDSVKIAQNYAAYNRMSIADMIVDRFKMKSSTDFDCQHNYISNEGVVHKGSIDASEGTPVLIPLNMRDGIILGKGKGNKDWNCSAPHGAGRKLSRNDARTHIDLKDYQETMSGIYSSVIGKKTLDEAPQAYKDSEDTLDLIKNTVDVEEIIHPYYNYKKR